tara:strand:- start:2951 stop:3481 length:531 start_codon:yes stop_codon:yes gene_type:complete
MSNKKINKKFVSINIVLITISDTRKEKDDKSGSLLEKRIINFGHKIFKKIIIKDNISKIKKTILNYSNKKSVDAIITTGGTGLTGRDSTPEALKNISDKYIEGFGELFRLISFRKIGTSTIQSRAFAAVVSGTYVFCLPGSPNACKDGWDEILKYQLDIRHKPCNFIEIMPRLKEN